MKNKFMIIGLTIVIILLLSVGIFVFRYNNKIERVKDNTPKQEEKKEETKTAEETDDNTNDITDNKNDNENNTDNKTTKTEDKETYEDGYVTASGYAGASDNVYYTKKGVLYHEHLSTKEKTKLAEGVKKIESDIGSLTAYKGKNFKIIKEDNYVTYKD